jgi:hypothetical protein
MTPPVMGPTYFRPGPIIPVFACELCRKRSGQNSASALEAAFSPVRARRCGNAVDTGGLRRLANLQSLVSELFLVEEVLNLLLVVVGACRSARSPRR